MVTLAFPPIDLFKHQEMDGKTKSSPERILLEPYKYLLQLPGMFVVCLIYFNPVRPFSIHSCSAQTRIRRTEQNCPSSSLNTFTPFAGKQVRTKLSQAFNHWLNVPDDKLQVMQQLYSWPTHYMLTGWGGVVKMLWGCVNVFYC